MGQGGEGDSGLYAVGVFMPADHHDSIYNAMTRGSKGKKTAPKSREFIEEESDVDVPVHARKEKAVSKRKEVSDEMDVDERSGQER